MLDLPQDEDTPEKRVNKIFGQMDSVSSSVENWIKTRVQQKLEMLHIKRLVNPSYAKSFKIYVVI